jgi:DNA-binding response OmpR family regulator
MEKDGPVTILVVDDEKEVCKTYYTYLTNEGFRTRVAMDGAEALVKVDDDVDIVLLDRRMPEHSGVEVLEFIRDWNLDCRVVMVTAVKPDESIIDMAFDGYLTKPVSQDELIQGVRKQVIFDRYQTLFEQYQTVTTKYALLASEGDIDGENMDVLIERRERLKQKLEETVEAFDNETVKETLADLHQSG